MERQIARLHSDLTDGLYMDLLRPFTQFSRKIRHAACPWTVVRDDRLISTFYRQRHGKRRARNISTLHRMADRCRDMHESDIDVEYLRVRQTLPYPRSATGTSLAVYLQDSDSRLICLAYLIPVASTGFGICITSSFTDIESITVCIVTCTLRICIHTLLPVFRSFSLSQPFHKWDRCPCKSFTCCKSRSRLIRRNRNPNNYHDSTWMSEKPKSTKPPAIPNPNVAIFPWSTGPGDLRPPFLIPGVATMPEAIGVHLPLPTISGPVCMMNCAVPYFLSSAAKLPPCKDCDQYCVCNYKNDTTDFRKLMDDCGNDACAAGKETPVWTKKFVDYCDALTGKSH